MPFHSPPHTLSQSIIMLPIPTAARKRRHSSAVEAATESDDESLTAIAWLTPITGPLVSVRVYPLLRRLAGRLPGSQIGRPDRVAAFWAEPATRAWLARLLQAPAAVVAAGAFEVVWHRRGTQRQMLHFVSLHYAGATANGRVTRVRRTPRTTVYGPVLVLQSPMGLAPINAVPQADLLSLYVTYPDRSIADPIAMSAPYPPVTQRVVGPPVAPSPPVAQRVVGPPVAPSPPVAQRVVGPPVAPSPPVAQRVVGPPVAPSPPVAQRVVGPLRQAAIRTWFQELSHSLIGGTVAALRRVGVGTGDDLLVWVHAADELLRALEALPTDAATATTPTERRRIVLALEAAVQRRLV
jgi:hypothetical protein